MTRRGRKQQEPVTPESTEAQDRQRRPLRALRYAPILALQLAFNLFSIGWYNLDPGSYPRWLFWVTGLNTAVFVVVLFILLPRLAISYVVAGAATLVALAAVMIAFFAAFDALLPSWLDSAPQDGLRLTIIIVALIAVVPPVAYLVFSRVQRVIVGDSEMA